MLFKSQFREDHQHTSNQAISSINSNPNPLSVACRGNFHHLASTTYSTCIDTGSSDHLVNSI